jgi:uncharacterized protein (TIGR02266 family)
MENERVQKRAELETVVRLRSPSLAEFIEEHSHDISEGGLFVRSDAPMPTSTLVKIEIEIDSATMVKAVGRVVWTRSAAREGHPSGMGIKFVRIDDAGRAHIAKIVKDRGDESQSSFERAAHRDQEKIESIPPSNGESHASEPPPAQAKAPDAKAEEKAAEERPAVDEARPVLAATEEEEESDDEEGEEEEDESEDEDESENDAEPESEGQARPSAPDRPSQAGKKKKSKRERKEQARARREAKKEQKKVAQASRPKAVKPAADPSRAASREKKGAQIEPEKGALGQYFWPLLIVLALVVAGTVYVLFFRG